MRNLLTRLALGPLVALGLLSWQAHAATVSVDWEDHATLDTATSESSTQFFTLGTGSFVATYLFTVDVAGQLAATLTAFQVPPALSVTFTRFALFEGTPTDPLPPVAKASFATLPSAATGPVELEQAGSYYYAVEGNVTGQGGSAAVFASDVAGAYVLTSTFAPTPIPEPGASALLAAGMLIALLALRLTRAS